MIIMHDELAVLPETSKDEVGRHPSIKKDQHELSFHVKNHKFYYII